MTQSLSDILASARPVYEIPVDDLIGEVLVPAFATASSVDVGAGFFSSHCLSQLAPGLASFLQHPERRIRILASTELSDEDIDAIEKGELRPEDALKGFSESLLATESSLASHSADCLAYLVAAGRLEIRVVLMQSGMYHKKKWIFRSENDLVAVHGSGNATARGLVVNGEQMTVDRPASDGEASRIRVEMLAAQFDAQWNNDHPRSLTVEATQILDLLRARSKPDAPPSPDDFWRAWHEDFSRGLEPELPPGIRSAPKRLAIPQDLDWHAPPYSHQAAAIDCLERHKGCGILSIATGGGKTRTALIAATRIQDESNRSVLVIILVPSKPLSLQWSEDVREFGVRPRRLSGMAAKARSSELTEAIASLQSPSRTEVIIATNKLWTQDEGIQQFVEEAARVAPVVLIADEVHNLGSATALSALPEIAQYRIGLSATPVRQYDEGGTQVLFDYFGGPTGATQPIFEFDLGQAIECGCLVPYRYHLHISPFQDDEMERYEELTDELRSAGFYGTNEDDSALPSRVERLLRERRALIEQARSKVGVLRDALNDAGARSLERALVYASAKAVMPPHEDRQIDQATELLADLGVISHQFTSAETSRANATELLQKFGRGDYAVLLAMKVLDEGIDIPQTDVAFLLASSTVEREWIQRRGRILRRHPNKTSADLHDFIVVPPGQGWAEGQRLVRSELRRAEHFARLAKNEFDPDGPMAIIEHLERAY